MHTTPSRRWPTRLAANALMWMGAWLLILSLISAGQTLALDLAPPDAPPPAAFTQVVAEPEPPLAPQATTAPLVILPETKLPSEQRSGSAAGEQRLEPTAQPPLPDVQSPVPVAPTRLVIPAIGLDAPVTPVGLMTVTQGGQTYNQWQVPDGFAAGWHESSAAPGQPGNTVLNGHHNINGQVFRYLVNLKPGDVVILYAGERVYRYRVSERHILPEKGQPLSVRLKNAAWIQPTTDERLTLVTCWPYTNNTHRLIVVARPAPDGTQEGQS